jgi:tRNA wybutosine-synthesizing protein 3
MTRFDVMRDNAMKQLVEAREEGKADEDIAGLVDAINAKEDFYTTSSCAGRIAILQTPLVHDKLTSEWLGKWHGEVTQQESKEALGKHTKEVV